MKNSKLIGMVLLAIVLCMNFVSCSDNEDEPNGGDNVTQKYIVFRSYHTTDDDTYSAEATYDKNNRLISIDEYADNNNNSQLTIDYSSNRMTAISPRDQYYYSFKLNDKSYITELSREESFKDFIERDYKATFTYNNEGYLIKSVCEVIVKQEMNEVAPFSEQTDTSITTTNHEWKDGNLVSSKTTKIKNGSLYLKENTYYQYTNIPNKGNIQPCYGALDYGLWTILYTERIADLLVSSCLFGKLSKDLPSVANVQRDDFYSRFFSYTLDENGFITSSTCSSHGIHDFESVGTFFYKN